MHVGTGEEHVQKPLCRFCLDAPPRSCRNDPFLFPRSLLYLHRNIIAIHGSLLLGSSKSVLEGQPLHDSSQIHNSSICAPYRQLFDVGRVGFDGNLV